MASPVATEPQWIQLPEHSPATYARPLLGAELFFAQMDRLNNGLGEVCFGFDFTAKLSTSELELRMIDALKRLRFSCPMIAADIRSITEDEHALSWLYACPGGHSDVDEWANHTLSTRPRPADINQFVLATHEIVLPYPMPGSRSQHFHAYLLLGDDGLHSLFFHGTHSLLDAKPTMRAFNLMLRWITASDRAALPPLAWGSEWQNLPVGPVTATGGPVSGWDTQGVALFTKAKAIFEGPPSPSLMSQRETICDLGKQIRIIRVLDANLTGALLARLKTYKFGVTHLFEAAMAVAVLSLCGIADDELTEMNFTYDMTVVSQDRALVPPYDVATRFLTGLILYPLTVPLRPLLGVQHAKARLIKIMEALKREYNELNSNPHSPHFMAAYAQIDPPRAPARFINENASMMTNFGVVEQVMTTSWTGGHATASEEDPDIHVEEITFGHRLPFRRNFVHVWTFNSCIHLQVQASDAWDQDVIGKYLDEIVAMAVVLLHDDEN